MTWRLAYVALFLPAIAACAADTFVSTDAGGSSADAGDAAATGPACGSSVCDTGQTCCVAMDGGPPSYACHSGCPTSGGGTSVASLACASTADCAGLVCCVEQSNGTTTSQCASQCGTSGVQLCDPNAADAGCPSDMGCSTANIGEWNLPSTFGTCGGRGVP